MLNALRKKLRRAKQTKPKLFYDGAHAGSVLPPSSLSESVMALEPRMLLDAAAVHTVTETAVENFAHEQFQSAVAEFGDQNQAVAPTAQEQDELLKALAAADIPGYNEIVFVDRSVEDYQELTQGISPNAELVFIEAGSDGLEQIASTLSNRENIDAIHIISHGNAGQLNLGDAVITQDSMQTEHADELATIRDALTEDADILIYGCNFAEGELGAEAATTLANLTGADVAASDDLTGSSEHGGDWDLEFKQGEIENNLIINADVQANWNGFLAAPVATDNSYDVAPDGSASGNVITDDTGRGSDSDADGDTIVVDPRLVSSPTTGTVTVNADGSFNYNQPAGTPVTDTFTYRAVSDSGITGLTYEFFDSVPAGFTVDNIPLTSPDFIGSATDFDVQNLALSLTGSQETYSVRYTGFINITTAGSYTFQSTSDDGSKVFIDGVEVVNNDGLHSPTTVTGAGTFISAGTHLITIEMFENTGGDVLAVNYSGPDTGGSFSSLAGSSALTAAEFDTATVTINPDTDGDGVLDLNDLDDDNDGILDSVENNVPFVLTTPEVQLITNPDTVTTNIDLSGFGLSIGDTVDISNVLAEGDLNGGTETFTLNFNTGEQVTGNLQTGNQYSGTLDPVTTPVNINGLTVIDIGGGVAGITVTATSTVQVNDFGGVGYAMRYVFDINGIRNNVDTDGDGIVNSLDLDSDNDGISDLVESGDAAGIALDTNNDGTVSLGESGAVDSDNDGIIDVFEDGNLAPNNGSTPINTDGDILADYIDLDSDNDGIADTVEARPTAGYTTNDGDVTNNDNDGDGIIDQFDNNDGTTGVFGGSFATPEDTDGDGTADYRDTDSDDDLVSDRSESGLTLSGTDADQNGIDDAIGATYADPDGNINDPANDLQDSGRTAEVDYREAADTDGDGILDRDDIDDDNDGILDTEEGFTGLDATVNTDGGLESGDLVDTSGVITSSNGDYDPNANFSNWNTTGTVDWSEGQYVRFSSTSAHTTDLTDGIQIQQSNVDGGAFAIFSFNGERIEQTTNIVAGRTYTASFEIGLLPDYGIPDGANGTFNPDMNFGLTFSDAADQTAFGINNDQTAIAAAANTSADYPDIATVTAAEPTSTGGTPILLDPQWELFEFTFTPTSDGTVTFFAQLNTNGVVITLDSLRLVEGNSVLLNENTDDDTVDNHLDLDSDNDGISDLRESGSTNAQFDTNGDGTISIAEAEAVLGVGNADADGDGLLDIFDADIGDPSEAASLGTDPVDSDSDGIDDYLDLDSDGDGISDSVEARPTAGYVANDGDTRDNDADGDGIIDIFDANDGTTGDFGGTGTSLNNPNDHDGDGIADYLDTDSDNDGILDVNESGQTLSGIDANNNGIDDATNAVYSDPDGDIDNPATDLSNVADGGTGDVDFRDDETIDLVNDVNSVDADNTGVITGDVSTNDPINNAEVDPATAYSLVSPPTSPLGTLTLNPDGTYSYDVDETAAAVLAIPPGSSITDVYTYQVTDADGDTATATLTITINGVNDAPEGTDNTVTTPEDTDHVFTSGDFGFTDPDTGDALSGVIISTLPTTGTLYNDLDGDGVVDPGETFPAGTTISVTDINNGQLKFKPLPDENGTGYDSFTFQVIDDSGAVNDTDTTPNTITIDVTPTDDIDFSITSTNSVSEEASGTATFTISVGGTISTGNTASVDINFSGTATNGVDHDDLITALTNVAAATTGVSFDGTDTLTFDENFVGPDFSFSVDAIDDPDIEVSETIVATLSAANTPTGQVTISTADTTTRIFDADDAVNAIDDILTPIDSDQTSTGTLPGLLANDVNNATSGKRIANDADLDDADGGQWDDEVLGSDNWTIGSNVSHGATTSAFPGISNAYTFTPDGSVNDGMIMQSLQDIAGGDPTGGDASFELWFRPNDFTGTTDEILFETGATTDGLVISLNGSSLNFITRDNAGPIVETSADLSTIGAGEFIQVVGVVDYSNTNDLLLYVNGNLVSQIDMGGYVDWAGGSDSGLGTDRNGSALAGVRATTDFDGEIAKFCFYDSALDAGQVLDNFEVISNADPDGDNSFFGMTVTSFDAVSANGATVVVNPDGSYSYDPTGSAAIQALTPGQVITDTFTYTITDEAGNTDTATVSIDVTRIDTIPTLTITDNNAGATGDESVVETGTLSSSFTVAALDGITSISVGGTTISLAALTNSGVTPIDVTTTEGVITINGFNAGTGEVSYSYDPAGTSKDHSGGEVVDAIAIVVTDVDGDTASDSLDILITDTAPTAVADTDSATEGGAAASGNVITNDTPSADTPNTVSAADQGGTALVVDGATVNTLTSGATIVIASDGSYTYTPPAQGSVPVGGVSDVINYTLTDSDGDSSVTTLTISVADNPTVPTVSITDNNAGATGDESVVETGTLSSSFTVAALDGITSISVGGTTISLAALTNSGVTPIDVTTTEGVITINGFNAGTGEVSYSYDPAGTSKDHSGGEVVDAIAIVVTDVDGDTASDSLDILITDTAPTAVADTDSATEGGAAASGNVITNDTPSADTPNTVSAADQGGTALVVDGATVNTLTSGATIVIASDGSYTYTPPAQGSVPVGGVSDVINYTLTDSDGDSSVTTLTISVADNPTVPTVSITDNNAGATGDESVVETGTLSSSFTVAALDGITSISVGGTTISLAALTNSGVTPIDVTTTEGVITINGFNAGTGEVSYSYDPAGTSKDHSGGEVVDAIAIVVTDVDGDTASDSLDILITDTAPTAVADTDSATEGGAAASGNVITNDTPSADTPNTVSAADQGGTALVVDGATVNTLTSGATIVIASDGSYTYTPPAQGSVPVGGVSDVINYTLTDSDGDSSVTTLTISVADNPTVPTVSITDNNAGATGDESVVETGTLSSSFTVAALDGITSISVGGTTISLAALTNSGVTPIDVTTTEGVITINGFNAGTGEVSYSYDPAGTSKDHSGGEVVDAIAVVVTDVDGDTASDSLDILITDTAPTAVADTDSATEGGAAASGNVITNDTPSADTPNTVSAADQGGTALVVDGATVNTLTSGATIVIASDGSYTYTPPAQGSVPVGGVSDVINYTLTDSDGDSSVTTLTISVADNPTVPTVSITDNNAGATGDESVVETGTLSSSFTVAALDGITSISVGGTTISLAALTNSGVTPIDVTTTEGVITINGFNAGTGEVSYSYDPAGTSKDHSGGEVVDAIAIVVTDVDGDTASDSLDILITDTAPTAVADTDSATEGGAAASGNVITNDTPSADTPNTVSAADQGGTALVVDGATVNTLTSGATIVIASDGSYTYTPPAQGSVPVGGVSDVINYTLTDSDGDSSVTTLTISVADNPTVPTVSITDNNAGATGDESVVETGTLSSSFTVAALDGITSISVGGTTISLAALTNSGVTPIDVTTTEGVITINGFNAGTGEVSYSYDPAGTSKDHSGGEVVDVIAIVVTDVDGDTASDSLDILITDTAPTAVADTDSATEGGAAASGNVITNDTPSADTPNTVSAADQGGTALVVDGATVNTLTSGATIVIASDGSYTYTPPAQGSVPVGGVSDVINYTLTDSDGDSSVTTLTISVADNPTVPTVSITDNNAGATGDESVVETGTLSSSFTVAALDGITSISVGGTTISLAALTNSGVTPIDVTTTEGVITINGFNAGTGEVSYSYDPAGTSKDHSGGEVVDAIAIVVTDVDGDTASDSLDILITDTAPTAVADTDSATEGGAAASGNVITNDTPSADTPNTVSAADQGGTALVVDGATVNTLTSGATIVIASDGSYTYTPPAQGSVPVGGVSDVINYTLTDSDGDSSVTTLTISVADNPTVPTVSITDNNAGATGDESVVETGTLSSSFTVAALDGITSISVGGTTISLAALTNSGVTPIDVTTTEGVITINGFNAGTGEVSYSYDPAGTSKDHSGGEVVDAIAVVVTDVDGDTASDTLDILITDTAPTAVADTDSATEGGAAASGNVITNDTPSADTPNTVSAADQGGTALVVDGATVNTLTSGATIVIASDGSYTYTPPAQGSVPVGGVSDVINYTLTDSDGDSSVTTLTITVADNPTVPTVSITDNNAGATGDESVVETGTLSSSFTVAALDGITSISVGGTTISLAALTNSGVTPIDVTTTEGVITINGFNAGTGEVSYSYDPAGTSKDHSGGEVVDAIAVVVTDVDGDTASDTLDILITDTAPTAVADTDSATEGGAAASGNVVTNDTPSADTPNTVSAADQGGTALVVDGATVNTLTSGATIVIASDGSYTYTPPAQGSVPVGGVSDVINYTLTDSDGDSSVTTLTISVADNPTVPTVSITDNNAGATGDESVVETGTLSSSFTVAALDGITSISVGGTTISLAALTNSGVTPIDVTTTEGVITINGFNAGTGEVSYSYDPAGTSKDHSGGEVVDAIAVVVTDVDGDTASDTLDILITDTAPTAVADTDSATEGGAAASGNVVTNDTPSADTPNTVSAADQGGTALVVDGATVNPLTSGATIVIASDGSYTYTPPAQGSVPVGGVSDVINYTLTDSDGDSSVTTLTITVADNPTVPTVSITDNNAGATGDESVVETGTLSSSFTVAALDGITSISVGGTTISLAALTNSGVTPIDVTTTEGVITINGFNAGTGEVSYSYDPAGTSKDHSGGEVVDAIAVVVTDVDGDTASDTLDILITDTAPTAVADTDSATEGGAAASGNVITNDTPSADTPNTVSAADQGGTALVVDGATVNTLTSGATIVIASDGSYTYTPPAQGSVPVGGVSDVINYTLTDSDGDSSVTTLTITVADNPTVPTVSITDNNAGATGDESVVETGTLSSSFTVAALDGITSISVGGTTISLAALTNSGVTPIDVTTTEGVITINGFNAGTGEVSYSYDPAGTSKDHSGGEVVDAIAVVVTDVDGDTASDTLDILITDTAPTAVADTDSATEGGAAASGNVVTNDTPSADTPNTVSAADQGGTALVVDGATVNTLTSGATIVIASDGSYTYTPPAQGSVPVGGVSDVINYTLTDSDGDSSVTTLTITVADNPTVPTVSITDNNAGATGDESVVETGTLSSSFTVAALDGITSISVGGTTISLAALTNSGVTPIDVTTTEGVITINGFNAGTGEVSYSYDPAGTSKDHSGGEVVDAIAVVVTDVDGDTASDTLDILITDTAPTAVADTDSATEGGAAASGNVVTNDTPSADTPNTVSAADQGGTALVVDGATVNPLTSGATIVIASDGSYTYTPPAQGSVPVGGVSDVINYTLTDSDGDSSVTTLTITVADNPTVPTVSITDNNAGATGDESVVETGTLSSSFTVAALDGITSISVGGTTISLAALTNSGVTPIDVTTTEGVITINGFNAGTGEVSYSYDPAGTSKDHSGGEVVDAIAVVVTDVDGDTASDTLDILITDTAPTAVADTDSATEGGAAASGNVVTNDTPSADTPNTVSAADQGGTALVVDGATVNPLTSGATIVIASDGSYTYTPPAQGSVPVGGVSDVINYTLTDSDGDSSVTTLTITVADNPTVPTVSITDNNAGATGDESVVETGTLSSSFTVAALDGITSISVGGTTISLAALTNSGVTPIDVTTTEGVITINGFNAGTGEVSYSYDPAGTSKDHSGGEVVDAIAVVVTDVDGDTASDTLDILITDTAPTAVADTDSATEGGAAASGNVVTNDTPSADTPNTVSAADQGGTALVVDGATVNPLTSGATIVIASDGSYTYTPPAQGSVPVGGVSDVINYTLTDSDGDSSVTTLTITVADNPTVPTVSITDNNAGATGDESVVETGTLSSSFTVAALDGITSISVGGTTISLAALTNSGVTPIDVTTTEGVITINGFNAGTGEVSYSYDPAGTSKDHSGGEVVDAIAVVVTDVDGDTASDTLDILITDTAPTAVADTDSATEGGAAASGNVVTNDTPSADTPNTVSAADQGGTALVVDGATVNPLTSGATIVIASDGSYTYTPPAQGSVPVGGVSDVINYTLTDSDGDSSVTTLTITVADNPTVPTVSITDNNAGATGDESVVETGTLSSSFTVAALDGITSISVGGTTISLAALTNSGVTPIDVTTTEGVITINGFNAGTGEVSYSYDPAGTSKDHSGGEVVDAIAVVVTDVDGDTASDTLDILITDTAPTAVADTDSATEGGAAASGNVITNDTPSADTPNTVSAADQGGTALVVDGATVNTLTSGATIVIASDGSYTYTPPAQGSVPVGGVSDVINYTLTDSDGDSSVTTLTISVINTPDAVNDIDGAIEGGAQVAGNVLNNDDIGTGPSTVTGVNEGGTPITIGTPFTTANGGILTINNDGTYTYTPPPTATVPVAGVTEVFTYTVTDSNGNTDTATLTINVVDQGDLIPDAADDAFTTLEDTLLTGDVSTNDPSPGDAPATYTAPTTSTNGGTVTMNPNGTFTYNPPADFFGTDTFTYTVTDIDGDIDTALVTITVTAVNDDPVANDDGFTVLVNSGTTNLDVITNDTDVDGGPLNITAVTPGTAGGTVVINGNTIDYTPPVNFVGTETFTYTIDDGNGGTSTATVTMTVNPLPAGPGGPLGPDEVVPENLLRLDDGFVEGGVNAEYNSIAAPGAVIDTVRSISSEQFGDQIEGVAADSFGLFDANSVKGFSLRSVINEANDNSFDTLFPLRLGEGDADVQGGDELIVETLIKNRTLYVEIDYLITSDPNLEVEEIKVTQVSGEVLPDWLRFDEDERLVVGEPPVDAEVVEFRIEVNLSNDIEVLRYFEVEVQTGVIGELSAPAETENLGASLFSDQVEKVAADMADSAADLAQVLAQNKSN